MTSISQVSESDYEVLASTLEYIPSKHGQKKIPNQGDKTKKSNMPLHDIIYGNIDQAKSKVNS